MKYSIIAVLWIAGACAALAQEGLRPLRGNPSLVYGDLKPAGLPVRQNPAQRTQAASLTIPFIEDFFYAPKSQYPDPALWSDSLVFVNSGYAKRPLSIGVATFDGLNKHGYPYDPNLTNNNISKPADRLTSQPINLMVTASSQTLQPSDSVALSFYYQSTGYGEPPESGDSLVLEFFAPLENNWYRVWYKTRNATSNPTKADSTFTRGFVWIDSTIFLQDNFRFRFRNSATTTGNFDHWHLDYIQLDKGRSMLQDTVYNDLTFAYVPTPFLRNYSAMPWEQFQPTDMAPNLLTKIRNNNGTFTLNVTYGYRIDDSAGNQLNTYNGLASNLPPFREVGYSSFAPHANPPVNYTFAAMADSTDYTITHFLFQSSGPSGNDFIPRNDTVVQYQRFRNYYALDDGGAEGGYYVNAASAKMAIKINVNNTDSFLGARIYFDPVGQINQAQNSAGFRIALWAAGSGAPGQLIFRDDTVLKPRYYNSDPSYAFAEYKLKAPKELSPGTYYIGIQQLADVMTIGFDRNVDHRTSLYFDSGSGWVQSTIPGSLMIRPIFGRTLPHPVGIDDMAGDLTKPLLVYPNPAADRITIRCGISETVSYSLLNTMGQQLGEGLIGSGDNTLDTSQLPNGIYLLAFKSGSKPVQQQKIIIQH